MGGTSELDMEERSVYCEEAEGMMYELLEQMKGGHKDCDNCNVRVMDKLIECLKERRVRISGLEDGECKDLKRMEEGDEERKRREEEREEEVQYWREKVTNLEEENKEWGEKVLDLRRRIHELEVVKIV